MRVLLCSYKNPVFFQCKTELELILSDKAGGIGSQTDCEMLCGSGTGGSVQYEVCDPTSAELSVVRIDQFTAGACPGYGEPVRDQAI